MASPTTLTLNEQSKECQLPTLDNFDTSSNQHSGALEALKSMSCESLDSVLQALDETDLLILEAIIKANGMLSKGIGEYVHLSSKTALARSRKLTGLGLLTCQTVSVKKGSIRPANLFSPSPGLTLEAVQKALSELRPNLFRGKNEMEQHANSNSSNNGSKDAFAFLDAVSLLILSLIGHRKADTSKSIRKRLQLKESPVRKRLLELVRAKLLVRREEKPFPHRPGLKEYHYSLAPSVDLKQVQYALSKFDLSNLPTFISPEVFVRQTGNIQPYTNGQANTKDSFIWEEKLSDSVKTSSEALSKEESSEILKILRKMAEKIAEYENRIAYLEAKERSRIPSQEVGEILALIPPTTP